MKRTLLGIAGACACLVAPAATPAATPLSVRDSFRIGDSGTIFCSAQTTTSDAVLSDMFDVGYSVTCRDAALPVGKLYKLRDSRGAAQRLAGSRAEEATCSAARTAQLVTVGTVEI